MTHPKQKATYYYKLFRVTRKCGKITTVSVDPILVTKACQVMGGLRNVGKLVRDAAFTYEAGMQKNCSSFVAERLRRAVTEGAAQRLAALELANTRSSVEHLSEVSGP